MALTPFASDATKSVSLAWKIQYLGILSSGATFLGDFDRANEALELACENVWKLFAFPHQDTIRSLSILGLTFLSRWQVDHCLSFGALATEH